MLKSNNQAIAGTELRSKRKVIIRRLEIEASIGAYAHERNERQPVIIDVEINVIEPEYPLSENLEDVLCYHKFVGGIEAIVAEGHIVLVETLAERIANLALANPLSTGVCVRVEKPHAIDAAHSVGIEVKHEKIEVEQ